jgi:F-type H+-transporting ATPase subunit epsilon
VAMQVELVSPERILFSGEADMVICRTVSDGEIAFLTGHAPFLGALAIHSTRIKRPDGTEEVAAVHGGFVHVRDNTVIILSDVAELASQIDAERARRAKETAEEKARDADDAEAHAALQRAVVRIDIAGA